MHPKVAQSIQEIDAALFSSDMFEPWGDADTQKLTDAKELLRYVERWQTQLQMNIRNASGEGGCHICGGPNH